MVVSTEILKEFINIKNLDFDAVCETLDKVGLEVEKRYHIKVPKNVVVGKVIKVMQHENADRLNVCDVDIGSEVLQIVCGAKNVKNNMLVAVALVGAKVIIGEKETQIVQSDIRGKISNGMLCSSTELGLPKMNDGIMVLDESIGECTLGKEISEFDIFNQEIFDIAITPNRGDCYYALGIAREIASSFNLMLHFSNTIADSTALGVGRFLQVKQNSNINSSLMYKIIDLKNNHTPLKVALILAINDLYKDSQIQNLMQYATYMTGVMMNAYGIDYNSNEMTKMIVKKDENGYDSVYKELENNEEKLSIVGLKKYKNVDSHYPRRFVIEANFIHKKHIFDVICEKNKDDFDKELVYKSQIGTSPILQDGMSVFCKSLQFLDSIVYSGHQDVISNDEEDSSITMTFSYARAVIGNDISKEEIAICLKKLGFIIQATNDEDFIIVTPPSFRSDIVGKQDVVEEILRLYSIDKIQSKPNIFAIKDNTTSHLRAFQKTKIIRQNALANGFIECIHYIFMNSNALNDFGFNDIVENKKLINPITQELDTLRPSLLPNMLLSLKRNRANGYENMKLFEIGQVYDENRTARLEMCLMIHKKIHAEAYPMPKGLNVDFFSFANILSNIIGSFECENIKDSHAKFIDKYQSAHILKESKNIGYIAKLNAHIQNLYDLDDVYFCVVDMQALLEILLKEHLAKSYSKYQANKRDLTILIDKNIDFSDIKKAILSQNIENLKSLYALDLFNENEIQNALTIRMILQSDIKTLNDDDMNDIISKVLDILKSKFGADLKK